MKFEDYAINITPLAKDEGGGVLVTMPDLPGLMADGKDINEAIDEAKDAFNAWTQAEIEDKGEMPKPKIFSGQFVQRLPKSLHQKLAKRARQEGVSLNQLVSILLAEGLSANNAIKS